MHPLPLGGTEHSERNAKNSNGDGHNELLTQFVPA